MIPKVIAVVLPTLFAWSALASPSPAQCAQWDPRFDQIDGTVRAMAVFDDGGGPALYVGGEFTTAGTSYAPRIAKWDGTSWSALGTGMNNAVRAFAVFDDGSGPALYAGGDFTIAGGLSAPLVARWDGTSWSALGVPGTTWSGFLTSMTVFDDGSGPALYVGGNFTSSGGFSASQIAKWDGTSWSALGVISGGTASFVTTLTVFDDGPGPALYAGGGFATAGGVSAPSIAKWNGANWSALGAPGSGMDGLVLDLLVHDDGSGPALYAGGKFTLAGGVNAPRVAKWNGTSWSSLGTGISELGSWVYTLTSYNDGSGPALYVGGNFMIAGGVASPNLSRWDGTSWSEVGPRGTGTNGSVLALTTFDDGSGLSLYSGGDFNTTGGISTPNLGVWDGTSWSAVGTPGHGMSEQVRALAVFDDGTGEELYAGGAFLAAGDTFTPRIAKWDGASWSALGAPGSGMNDVVLALTVFDDGSGPALYAGGSFTTAGDVPAAHIAKWSGTSWSPLGSGLDLKVYALTVFDDGSGPALYAGGTFTTAGGVAALRVAKWNGTSWSALGPPGSGMNALVLELTVFDDGSGPALYAGGSFTTAGGVPAAHVAKWNGTSWSAMGFGFDSWVNALTVFDFGTGPMLYAGGAFTSSGGFPALSVAQWNGTSWSAVGSGIGGTAVEVETMTVFDDGSGPTLVAGGTFTTAGSVPVLCIARWNGTTWSAFGAPGSGTNQGVYALAAFDDGSDRDADLYVGGIFSTAGGLPSANIAEWHGCGSVASLYCFGDGSVVPCPCGNSGLPGRGCNNSSATGGAVLTFAGTISPDALVLMQQGELSSSLSIFLQGSQQLASPVVFGDGLRCAGGSLKRLFVKSASGGVVSAPAPGDLSITAQSAALGDPVSPGSVRHYQVYYRDPNLTFCPAPQGNSFNVGNALRITW
jgi:hypothetical protein